MNAKPNQSASKLKLVRVVIVAGTFVASVFIAGNFSMALAQTPKDSASVQEFVTGYQHTFNTHDPAALAAFFTEDADFVMYNLPGVQGRQAIGNWWRDYWQSKFNKQEPGRRAAFNLNSIRFLAADVALANIEATTGGTDSLGAELPARKARGTWLLHRQNRNWLISAMRGLPTEDDSVELVPSLETAKTLKPQLRAFVAAYEDSFNQHDPGALSMFYRDDADIIVRNGPVIHGAQAIRKWWRAYFSRLRPPGLQPGLWTSSYRAIMIIDEIKMMTDKVTLLNITATGAPVEATEILEPVRLARATWIVVRENGEWCIAALRVLPGEDDRVIRAEVH